MNVRIFDTTLRDGEQTPGVSLSPQQKLDIAQKIDDLGVDAIEAGFPVISKGENEAIKMISKAGLKAQVCGLARANKADIDAAADAGLQYVHTFIATSDIHLEYKLHMSVFARGCAYKGRRGCRICKITCLAIWSASEHPLLLL